MIPKFKAWLKEEKKMVKVSELRDIDTDIRSDQNVIYFDFEKQEYCNKGFDEVELIQCTGRKDKNNVEIYTGYIVECEGEICTVVWDDYYLAYVLYSKEFGYDNLGDFESKYLEVIGNIYENPELLGVRYETD